MDEGGELSVLGALATSTCLPATTMVVATLSLGRSISAATAVGPALLLLLGELGVHCHTPNTFGTVNMERTVDLRLSWSEQ